ncbi:MAG: 50S ribosomal protein L3 [Spirochaetes bacterium]|nr:50S ribosomal protein L3 [Spirochaetota bacterium]
MIGLIGEKIGMTQCFDQEGEIQTASVIKIEPNYVVQKRTMEKDGYNAVVLGIKDLKEKKVNKPYKGIFTNDVVPKKVLKEFRTDDIANFEIGQELTVSELENIEYLDVTGISKGKGFQGVMKRHGFSGGRKTHGSKFHRQNGSTGQCSYPSRVFKGLKRAGRMGADKVTVQSLKVIKIDTENNCVMIKGSVPGNPKGIILLQKACKK